MRFSAVSSAAAGVLLEIPEVEASDAPVPAVSDAPGAADQVSAFLSTSSVFGLSLGSVLWLSVAAVAMVLAFVALNVSRNRGAAAAPAVSAGLELVGEPEELVRAY